MEPPTEKYYSISPYAYVLNNPLRYIDPDGRIPWDRTVASYTRIGDGYVVNRGTSTHRGQDLSAQQGTAVNSFAKGTVVAVSTSSTWGNYVVVSHGDSYYSLYAHLEDNSTIVSNGQQVASVGSTGRSSGPHLHLEVGQAGSLNEFLSTQDRDNTRTDPVGIGDLENFLHPVQVPQSNNNSNNQVISSSLIQSKDQSFQKQSISIKGWIKELENRIINIITNGIFND